MNKTTFTLNQLFELDKVELSGEAMEKMMSKESAARLAKQFEEKAGPTWNSVRQQLPNQLKTFLDIDVAEILIGVWNKSKELQKYRDPVKYPPEEVSLVSLLKHEIESTHQPYVDVLLNGRSIAKVHFEIKVELTLEGVELQIQGGRIMAIKTGDCSANGAIKCEGASLLEKKTKTMALPGVINLGEGIVIPR